MNTSDVKRGMTVGVWLERRDLIDRARVIREFVSGTVVLRPVGFIDEDQLEEPLVMTGEVTLRDSSGQYAIAVTHPVPGGWVFARADEMEAA